MYRIYTHIYVCMHSRFSAELGNKHTPLFLANPPRDQLAYQKAERTQNGIADAPTSTRML